MEEWKLVKLFVIVSNFSFCCVNDARVSSTEAAFSSVELEIV